MANLTDRVVGALDKLCEQSCEREWRNTGWMRKVKRAIIGLTKADGQCAYASSVDETEGEKYAAGGEWLYDLTWLDYDNSPEKRFLKRTVLVLESEWDRNRPRIEGDFHKLLLARADLRVMVFQARNLVGVQGITNRLITSLNGCEQAEPGDKYLFSGWRTDIRNFKHRRHEHGTA